MMSVRKPHFLMFCDSSVAPLAASSERNAASVRCNWTCVIDNLEHQHRTEINDTEQILSPERGPLLAVVRGLESLEQPSEVTLVTASSYVNKGLRYGLSQWRESNYQWEHFGSEKPIRNADLWQRVDAALQFHKVDCRLIQSNLIATNEAEPNPENSVAVAPSRLKRPKFVEQKRPSKYWLAIRNLFTAILQIPERTVFAAEALLDALCGKLICAAKQIPAP